jgi:hypothetical protein
MSISFFSQETWDIRLRWVLSIALTIFMFVLVRFAVNKASEPNPIDKLAKQLDSQDEQHKFLEQFPLGYVVFETDAVTGSFTPTGARQGLEAYAFNFQKAKVVENTQTKITIRLPDVMKNGKTILSGNDISGDKVTMMAYSAGSMFTDDDNYMVFATARSLKYSGDRVMWIYGLRRGGKFPLLGGPLPTR